MFGMLNNTLLWSFLAGYWDGFLSVYHVTNHES
jgi:hypothetical protein